ncbi:hypothetical protein NQ176_g4693 [Zarea fungicola]|uniref:Uncharacterized protein n=1 Tax=Zarea fungicola TaxID=93591 RepID=A0ACC1NE15_9HYPO|nr:hypothetical protein NQ176_g4693 [Lecanicillium fungicola]
MIFSTVLGAFSILLAPASATPVTAGGSCHAPPVGPRTLYTFANGTQLENIAVRSNGNLLLTRINKPELYEFNPSDPSSGAKLLQTFPGYVSLLGITELTPDVFAFITGNFTFPAGGVAKSFSIWTVAIHDQDYKYAKVADILEATLLNGLATLNAGAVLASDSTNGVVYRVDIKSGNYEAVLDDASFKPPAGAPIAVGINGLRLHDEYAYYTNTFGQLFGRVRIDANGRACGTYEIIARNVLGDDFAIGSTASYIAGNFQNVVTKIEPGGKVSVFAGNISSTLVAGATSAQFGRTWRDKNVLYVVTNGGEIAPVNGFSEGGKIVAFDV